MSESVVTRATIELLGEYDTPTVCNVIELFDVRPCNTGYMGREISACFPALPPMVGLASTATFRSAAPAGDSAYSSLEAQAEAIADMPCPPVMVFEDLDAPCAAATFGEVMCTTYKAFGAAGLVTSGAGRDLQQVAAIEFPVFTNGAICAHGYCHIPSVDVPVTVGGLAIRPGDLLHGDCNGVTSVPLDIAADVATACEPFMAAEAVVFEYLKGSRVTPAGLREATGELHRRIDALKAQLVSGRER